MNGFLEAAYRLWNGVYFV